MTPLQQNFAVAFYVFIYITAGLSFLHPILPKRYSDKIDFAIGVAGIFAVVCLIAVYVVGLFL